MNVEVPEEGRCFFHTRKRAIAVCDDCGAFFCAECGAIVGGERVLCKKCIGRDYGPARWEKTFAGGGVLNFLKTLKDVLISPTRFFHSVDGKMPISSVILFAIICEVLGMIAVVIWGGPKDYFYLIFGEDITTKVMPHLNLALIMASPFIAVVSLFTIAGIYQAFARLFGGKGSYLATLKVIGYSSSANLIVFIPYVGGILSIFYGLILYSRGFSRVHQIGPFRSAALALLPIMILLLALVIFGMFLFQSVQNNIPNILGEGKSFISH
ncbi:MAG: YIP1 family protein [bacterium]